MSPDGRRVAYMGVQGGQPSGQARLVGTRGGRSRLLARDATTGAYWSPSGRYVVVGRHVDRAPLIVDGAWLNDLVRRRRRYVALNGPFSRAGFSPNSAIALIAYEDLDVEATLELRIGHRGLRDVNAPTLPLWGRRGLVLLRGQRRQVCACDVQQGGLCPSAWGTHAAPGRHWRVSGGLVG